MNQTPQMFLPGYWSGKLSTKTVTTVKEWNLLITQLFMVSILEHRTPLLKLLLKYITCQNTNQTSGTRALRLSHLPQREKSRWTTGKFITWSTHSKQCETTLRNFWKKWNKFPLTKALIQKPDSLMQSKVPSSKHWVINKYIIVTEDPRETSANSHGKLNPFLENMSF